MHPMIEYRATVGLTQEGLADALGVPRQYVTRWEAGAKPNKTRRVQIERATDGGIPADSWEGGKK